MEVLAGDPDFIVELVCQVARAASWHEHDLFGLTCTYRASPIAVSASTSPKYTGIRAYILNTNVS